MGAPTDSIEHLRETPLARREIYSGRLLHVVDDEVRFEDGKTAHREVVLHPGAVAVVAVDETGRAVLVRQWRYATGRALWEIPAGTRDVGGEAPAETARRELQEETGFSASTWRELGAAHLAPGYSSEEMHFFLATGLVEGAPRAEDDERLDVARFTPAEVSALVSTAAVDVKTIAGLALAGWNMRFDG